MKAYLELLSELNLIGKIILIGLTVIPIIGIVGFIYNCLTIGLKDF